MKYLKMEGSENLLRPFPKLFRMRAIYLHFPIPLHGKMFKQRKQLYIFTTVFCFNLFIEFCVTISHSHVFFFGARAPIWALAYLHETLRFTSVF
jgi:hypothetical protein